MAVAQRPPPPAGHELPPDWSALPDEPPPTRRRVIVRIAVRAAVAVAVAALMWALGHEVPAVILLAVSVVATGASLASRAVASALDRGTAAIQHWAGRVLAVVVLGAMQLLVFTPVALVLRLLRQDPLALGLARDAPSRWRPTPRRPGHGAGAGLYRRTFAYEHADRRDVARGRLPLLRLRAVLGLVALLALADVAVGSALNALEGDDEPARSLLPTTDVPAARGEPWIGPVHDELSRVWDDKVYDPELGWATPGFSGRHVRVADGVRRSAQAPAAVARDAREVWFFGGSAMFGLFQRDAHTIPSEIARLAAADGVRVRVVNRGVMAYTNWQEVGLLERLLTRGEVPDAVVFYDGFNELLSQFQLGPHDEPSHLAARDTAAALAQVAEDEERLGDALHNAWAQASAAHRVARAVGLARPLGFHEAVVRSPFAVRQDDDPARRGVLAAAIHARGVDVARRLADSYGFLAYFFWQPSIFTKRVLPEERPLEHFLGAEPDSWRAALRAARARLAPRVRDVSDALDAARTPVMYDFVHTNEAGAAAVARRLYAELRPGLRAPR